MNDLLTLQINHSVHFHCLACRKFQEEKVHSEYNVVHPNVFCLLSFFLLQWVFQLLNSVRQKRCHWKTSVPCLYDLQQTYGTHQTFSLWHKGQKTKIILEELENSVLSAAPERLWLSGPSNTVVHSCHPACVTLHTPETSSNVLSFKLSLLRFNSRETRLLQSSQVVPDGLTPNPSG